MSSTRREHPGLLFEICNDGGRMVDFGSAAHGDYFSITDTYDPLSNRRAFYDTSHLLPAAMLESYVEKWPTPHLENFLYMLRSGMMGWTTIMTDTTAWTPEQHAAARQAFALYKNQPPPPYPRCPALSRLRAARRRPLGRPPILGSRSRHRRPLRLPRLHRRRTSPPLQTRRTRSSPPLPSAFSRRHIS